MTWWRRRLGVAALLAALVAPAQAALTWVVVTDQDCSGAFAASALTTANIPCCRGTATGGGSVCSQKLNMGDKFVRPVTLVVGSSAAYTATGDALSSAAIQRIGLTNVVFASCNGASTGQDVSWVQTAGTAGATWGAKLQLFQTGGGGTTPVTNGGEFAGSLANASVQCLIFGY